MKWKLCYRNPFCFPVNGERGVKCAAIGNVELGEIPPSESYIKRMEDNYHSENYL